MKAQTKSRSNHDLVMFFYIAVGAGGLLFFAVTIIDQIGWLEPAVRSIFGDRSEIVLELLYGVGIIFTYLLGFFLVVGWIPAIWIVIKFRKSWPVWAPSALLLITEILLISSLNSEWIDQTMQEYLFGTMFAIFFVSALYVGLRMLRDRKEASPG